MQFRTSRQFAEHKRKNDLGHSIYSSSTRRPFAACVCLLPDCDTEHEHTVMKLSYTTIPN